MCLEKGGVLISCELLMFRRDDPPDDCLEELFRTKDGIGPDSISSRQRNCDSLRALRLGLRVCEL